MTLHEIRALVMKARDALDGGLCAAGCAPEEHDEEELCHECVAFAALDVAGAEFDDWLIHAGDALQGLVEDLGEAGGES